MYLGQAITLLNFALLGAALVIYFADPAIATVFLYGLILWMFASLVLFYLPISRRRIGGGPPRGVPPGAPGATPTAAPGAGAPSPAPLASGPGASSGLGFCIYCAAVLPPGAGFCPACGKPVRSF